jgi:hypothetical protein
MNLLILFQANQECNSPEIMSLTMLTKIVGNLPSNRDSKEEVEQKLPSCVFVTVIQPDSGGGRQEGSPEMNHRLYKHSPKIMTSYNSYSTTYEVAL